MQVRTPPPLVSAWHVWIDKSAAEHLGVAVRAIWTIGERGRLSLLATPPPYQPVDECVGEPGLSSVRYEADTGPLKPGTDCALVGSAVAPKGRASRVDVSFRVGPVAKRARVVGERKRLFWLLRWWNTPAASFARVPLVWERAAGGTDETPKNPKKHSLDPRNPYGRGFRARGSKLPGAGALLPQVLAPGGCLPLGRGREPAGFGLTGPQWKHRRPFVGTYDDAWLNERCPLLPLDFDERFHLAAAPGLSSPEPLAGGEPVEVRGCTPSGRLAFELPVLEPQASATLEGEPEPVPLSLATVTVDTDAMQLRMLWRGALNVHGRVLKLRRIDVRAEGLST